MLKPNYNVNLRTIRSNFLSGNYLYGGTITTVLMVLSSIKLKMLIDEELGHT